MDGGTSSGGLAGVPGLYTDVLHSKTLGAWSGVGCKSEIKAQECSRQALPRTMKQQMDEVQPVMSCHEAKLPFCEQ